MKYISTLPEGNIPTYAVIEKVREIITVVNDWSMLISDVRTRDDLSCRFQTMVEKMIILESKMEEVIKNGEEKNKAKKESRIKKGRPAKNK